ISIDDFGTGYSSLNKLKDYPVDTLKIDKSFIDSIPENISSCNIVKTIIDLAHFLDFKVVAEGVEEEGQAELLYSYNCDLIQGYFYHKPLSQNDFVALIRNEGSGRD
ncbi:MAG: EAL domain-containing protein, partial [Spirochaetaceae bacterium]|nr:EAL domain-containing protein [Spirochaetaceae bacterium]